jgi:hypothetical protein
MAHQHTWKVVTYLLLSLPTTDQFSERLTQWICTSCGTWNSTTGLIKHMWPLETPEFWERAERQAQQQRTR